MIDRQRTKGNVKSTDKNLFLVLLDYAVGNFRS